jgi:hypothetical protein
VPDPGTTANAQADAIRSDLQDGGQADTEPQAPDPVLPPSGRVTGPGSSGDVVLDRAECQIRSYGRAATRARLSYLTLKIVQLAVAALVPVTAAVHTSAVLTGGLGGLVVVVEGLQQLFRFHENWIRYRATCESLLSEKYLYAARAGDYQNYPEPRSLLAQRTEMLCGREAAQWIQLQQPNQPDQP